MPQIFANEFVVKGLPLKFLRGGGGGGTHRLVVSERQVPRLRVRPTRRGRVGEKRGYRGPGFGLGLFHRNQLRDKPRSGRC